MFWWSGFCSYWTPINFPTVLYMYQGQEFNLGTKAGFDSLGWIDSAGCSAQCATARCDDKGEQSQIHTILNKKQDRCPLTFTLRPLHCSQASLSTKVVPKVAKSQNLCQILQELSSCVRLKHPVATEEHNHQPRWACNCSYWGQRCVWRIRWTENKVVSFSQWRAPHSTGIVVQHGYEISIHMFKVAPTPVGTTWEQMRTNDAPVLVQWLASASHSGRTNPERYDQIDHPAKWCRAEDSFVNRQSNDIPKKLLVKFHISSIFSPPNIYLHS